MLEDMFIYIVVHTSLLISFSHAILSWLLIIPIKYKVNQPEKNFYFCLFVPHTMYPRNVMPTKVRCERKSWIKILILSFAHILYQLQVLLNNLNSLKVELKWLFSLHGFYYFELCANYKKKLEISGKKVGLYFDTTRFLSYTNWFLCMTKMVVNTT